MALSKAQRISISKKIISIPDEAIQSDNLIAQLDIDISKAQDVDNGNKALVEDYNTDINSYQKELGYYNGDQHEELQEQDFLDGSIKKLGADFFPNDVTTSLPSIPDGVWKFYTPFSGNIAIGKKYNETFTSISNELDYIDTIKNLITTIEGFDNMERSTGQRAIAGVGEDPDTIEIYTVFRNYGTDLISAISSWKSLINTIYAEVNSTETDATKISQNTDSKDDIDDCIPIIETWEALDDYDTSHGETTYAGFYAHDYTTLNPTKFRDSELNLLKAEVLAREIFVNSRIAQLDTNLGAITTDPANGQVSTATGLYGDRFRFIDIRLNLITGSLSKVAAFNAAKQSQLELKVSNSNANTAYSGKMTVSKFRATASGGKAIHVFDASGFSVSDSIYICGDSNDEISGIITEITNNIIYLNVNIPKYYTTEDNSRIYKIL